MVKVPKAMSYKVKKYRENPSQWANPFKFCSDLLNQLDHVSVLSVSKVRSERTLVVLLVVVVVTGVDVVLWGVVVGVVVLIVVIILSVVCVVTVLLETVVGKVVLTGVGSGFGAEVDKISIFGLTFPATPLFS